MSEIAVFCSATGLAALVMLWRRDCARVLAFGIVPLGLLTMWAIRGNADGIVAFAVWTLASYLLLNFPKASTLFLLSAFCYILKLYGVWVFQIQIASNVLGVIGLVAIWNERPRWEHGFAWGAGGLFSGALASHAQESHPRPEKQQDAT